MAPCTLPLILRKIGVIKSVTRITTHSIIGMVQLLLLQLLLRMHQGKQLRHPLHKVSNDKACCSRKYLKSQGTVYYKEGSAAYTAFSKSINANVNVLTY